MSYTVFEIKDVLDAITLLGASLSRVEDKVDKLSTKGTNMAKTLDELIAELDAAKTSLTEDNAQTLAAVNAAIALLQGVVAQNAAFKVQIAELIAMNPTPAQLAKLEEITGGFKAVDEGIDASVKALSDATAASQS